MSQFIEMFGTLDEPKVNVSKLIDVVVSSGQYGSNTSATDYQEGKPRYIRITDINDDGSLNDDIKTAEVIDDKYRLESGDIVFARTGATVGKTYLHEAGDAIYAGYLIKYQMDSELMKPLFMKAFTHSKTYYNWVANSQKVGAQPNISATQYDQMPILVPSVDEQEAFLKIYQQADKSKFADFKSQFIEMFKDCPIVKLEDNIKTQSGGTPNTKKQEYYNGGDIPWLSSGEVNQGYIFSTEKFITQAGLDNSSAKWVPKYSVLIAMYGATAGKVGFSMIPLTTNQAVCALLPCSSFNSLFLYYAVSQKTDWMISQCRGAAQPNISQGIIRSMEIAKPPMEQQEQFAAIAEQADKSKSHVLKALKETEILLQHSIRQVV